MFWGRKSPPASHGLWNILFIAGCRAGREAREPDSPQDPPRPAEGVVSGSGGSQVGGPPGSATNSPTSVGQVTSSPRVLMFPACENGHGPCSCCLYLQGWGGGRSEAGGTKQKLVSPSPPSQAQPTALTPNTFVELTPASAASPAACRISHAAPGLPAPTRAAAFTHLSDPLVTFGLRRLSSANLRSEANLPSTCYKLGLLQTPPHFILTMAL